MWGRRKKTQKSADLEKIPVHVYTNKQELLILVSVHALTKEEVKKLYETVVEDTGISDWRIIFYDNAYGSIQAYEENRPLIPVLLEDEDRKKLIMLVKNMITEDETKSRLLWSLQDLEHPV